MPLDVPGCTRATMIIAVSVLQSSCADILKFNDITFYFVAFTSSNLIIMLLFIYYIFAYIKRLACFESK